ncbi:hypothetical protein [Streptomyces sp. NPDC050263]|uniref:hypothetical protein n=1 Tax=Streptomyces sp. NPDC050263 TaxID=3155037 RepID=UPI0034444877
MTEFGRVEEELAAVTDVACHRELDSNRTEMFLFTLARGRQPRPPVGGVGASRGG